MRILTSFGLAAVCCGFGKATYLDTRYKSINNAGVSSEFPKIGQNKGKRDASVRLLSDVNAAIEFAGISGGDYSARITRKVQFDALRIKDWFLHFGTREESLLDPSPSQLDHELEYLGIGYETTNGRIKFLWDHTCHNPSRKLPENKKNGIHWNELGIGYETMGMMLGHKNHRIKIDSGFRWLNNLNYRASLSRIWMTTENDYEWMLKLCIRDDILRMRNQIFYIQIDLDSIHDDRGTSLDTCVEIGDRIILNRNASIIPFASYKHFHDWYGLGVGEDFYSAGLSLEMCLGHENYNNFSRTEEIKVSWTPELHISGGYSNILDDEEYGHSSDADFDLYLLKLDHGKKLSLNSFAGILTLPHDLNPYIVMYRIGPSLEIDFDDFELRIFYSYSCVYGLEDESVMRNYNLLGLGLRNIDTSNWNWNVKTGFYPATRHFDYWGDLEGSLGYSLFREGISPYINCSGHSLQGNTSLFGHAIEAGVRIPGKAGNLSVYLSQQDDFDVFRFGRGTRTLLGVRLWL